MHEEPFAEAVAAEATANLAAEQEGRVRILVLNARSHGDRTLVAGVEATPTVQLFRLWNDEPPNRVVRIAPVDQPQVVVVCAEGVPLGDELKQLALARQDLRNLVESADITDARSAARPPGDASEA